MLLDAHTSRRPYRMTKRGESGIEAGVPGKPIDGEPPLEYSNECECDSGGVWQIYRQS